MEALVVKLGARAPILIARALAGDPSAIALLAVLGVAVGAGCLTGDR